MARQYKAGLLITGDAKGAVAATRATKEQLEQLNKSHKSGSRYAKEHASALGNLGSTLKGLLPVISVGLFAGMIKSSIDAQDQIQKLSIRIGASTEALSEYKYIAELSGVAFDSMATSWQRGTRRISEAAAGTGVAKDALKELGLSATRLKQLKPEDQFEAIAAQLSKVADHSDKVRLANKFWDTDGVRMLQIVDAGADGLARMREEARSLGLSLSRDQVDAAAAANDALTKLGAGVEGLSNQLAINLAPALTTVIRKMEELYSGWKNVGEVLSIYENISGEKEYITLLNRRRELLQKIVEVENSQDETFKRGMLTNLPTLNFQLEEVNKKIAALRKETEPLVITINEASGTSGGGGLKGLATAAKEVSDEFDVMGRAMDLIDQEFKALDEAEARSIAGLESIAKETKKVTKTVKTETDKSAAVWGNWIDQLTSRAFDGFDSIADMFRSMLQNMAATAAANTIKIGIGTLLGGASSAATAGSSLLSAGSSGINLFGGFNNPSSLLGIGSTIAGYGGTIGAGLAGGAGITQSAMLAAQTAEFGLGGAMLTGEALGAGTLGTLGAGIGAAIPYIGAAVALAGLFGGIGGKSDYAHFANLTEGDIIKSRTNSGGKYSEENEQAALGAINTFAGLVDTLRTISGEADFNPGRLGVRIGSERGFNLGVGGTYDPVKGKSLGGEDYVQHKFGSHEKGYQRLIDTGLEYIVDSFIEQSKTLSADIKTILRTVGQTTDEVVQQLEGMLTIQRYLDADILSDYADAVELANRTLYEAAGKQHTALLDLISTYDGAIDSTTALSVAIQDRYNTELALLDQIGAVSASISRTLGTSIEQMKIAQLDTEGRYEYWRAQAESLAVDLETLIDPAAINATVSEINRLTNLGFGLLDERQIGGQEGNGLIDYLEGVEKLAQERLDVAKETLITDSAELQRKTSEAMERAAQQQLDAAKMNSVAAIQLSAAVARLTDQGVGVNLTVNDDGTVTGGR